MKLIDKFVIQIVSLNNKAHERFNQIVKWFYICYYLISKGQLLINTKGELQTLVLYLIK